MAQNFYGPIIIIVGIFPSFKPKEFFSVEEKAQIVEAIRLAEKETSVEIRIFVESKNPFVDPTPIIEVEITWVVLMGIPK